MIIKKVINKFKSINKSFFLFIKTPRLSILIFQIRYIERYLKLDMFFLSPRRFLIYLIEIFMLKSSKSIKLQDYGNYKLKNNMIPNNPIIYSGGVGTNVSFDLEILKKKGGIIRLFDPTKQSIDYIKSLGKKKNFKFYPYALYFKNKKIKLYKDPSNRIKSSSINNFLEFNYKSFYYAQAYNLSYLMKKFKDKKIDILKLDIEGVAEDLILDLFKKKKYPAQIVSAFEIPLNYIKFIKFVYKFLKFIAVIKKNYYLYNLRYRSRGVEMEILAIKKRTKYDK